MSKNPCQQFIDFYGQMVNAAQKQVGLFGGIDYNSFIKSDGVEYQIACKNNFSTWKFTELSVRQKFTGTGFANSRCIYTDLDPKTGRVKLVDVFGNRTSIQLPIPDKLEADKAKHDNPVVQLPVQAPVEVPVQVPVHVPVETHVRSYSPPK
jgi:hypothetical protein